MTNFAAAIAPHFQNVNEVHCSGNQIRFFFFSIISLCLRKRKKGRKKKRKKENSSYALYLISKIICDRPFSFFPFFTCITYRIDRLRDNVILLLRTYYPNPSGFFFLVRLFLHFNFTGLTNVLIKEKTEWNPLLEVHTGASSCKWSILTPGKMYQKMYKKAWCRY